MTGRDHQIQLRRLEAEAIHVFRAAAAEFAIRCYIGRTGEVAEADDRGGTGRAVLIHFAIPRRAAVRELIGQAFFVVFVDTPLAIQVAPDPKGLYCRALAGAIRNFTGVDEPPTPPELRLWSAADGSGPPSDQVVDLPGPFFP